MKSTKVILILVDGMRPDSILECNNSVGEKVLKTAAWKDMKARTVFPSITLPCHMSLFHGVTPQKHGVLTNMYFPMAHEYKGLAEVLHDAGKKVSFFYTWEELRDLAKPGSLCESCFATMYNKECPDPEDFVTNAAITAANNYMPDFAFLYLGIADETGHKYGWMSKEYLKAISNAWDNIGRVINNIPNDYRVIITADHGGHGFNHGSNDPLDMTIPIIFWGDFNNITFTGKEGRSSILDISPTIVKWLDVAGELEWEGNSLTQ